MDLLTAPAAFDMAPGLKDPVADSQAVFRAAMDAMARPGTIGAVGVSVSPPAPLGTAMAAIALSLLDYETRFWVPEADGDARSWIRFHTGARVAGTPEDADFVLVPRGQAAPRLETLRLGTDEEPDTSATVIAEVASLAAGAGLVLSGPGIDGERLIAIGGMPVGLLESRRTMASMFPRGVDLILTAGNSVAAIPRTTRLEG